MKIRDEARESIIKVINSLFYTLEARFLGHRFFRGPKIFFSAISEDDLKYNIESLYAFTLFNLFGTNARPDQSNLEKLAETAHNYVEAARLKAINSVLMAVTQADDTADVKDLVGGEFKKISSYVDMLTTTESKFVQSAAEKDGIIQVAASLGDRDPTVAFYGVLDSKICKYCRAMYHTKANPRKPKVYKMSELKTGYFKPKEWDGESGFSSPLHPHCFDDQTEVLSSNGWQLFKDLSGKEQILSVNLETGNAEWVNIHSKVEWYHKGELVHYKNRSTDLMITDEHMNVVKIRYHKPTNGSRWSDAQLVKESELGSDYALVTTISDWVGADADTISFGTDTFQIMDFAWFLGIYLSEGYSWYNPRMKTFVLSITQEKENVRKEIIEVMSKMFPKLWIAKGKIHAPTNNTALYEYLHCLGKSHEKYIPNDFKQYSKLILERFLDAYIKGDGSVKKGKLWKNHQFGDSFTIFTSSKRMADDIGELILKIGKRPKYKLDTPKAIKHRNGTYTTKHPCWRVSINNGTYPHVRSLGRKRVKYEGIVYDVELVKNHTLFVRRNGSVVLSGNCRHVATYIPKNYGLSESGQIVFMGFGYDEYENQRKNS